MNKIKSESEKREGPMGIILSSRLAAIEIWGGLINLSHSGACLPYAM